MKWSSILSDLQTGAYTTLHIASATQPRTLVLFCTTKLSSVQRTVCVCAWSTDYEHEKKQMLVRCTSAARCDFSPITGFVPDALFRPQNKTVHWLRNEATHTHSELGSMQTGRQSCLLHQCGHSGLGPYLLRMKGNEGLCTGRWQWRPIRWLYWVEGAGCCCCRWLSHRDQFSLIGGWTLDWVVFSAEWGGADLALLHTELSPPQART